MSKRIITNKDKAAVLKWAKKQGRKVLWQDVNHIWHAATDEDNVPGDAIKMEDVE